MKVSYAVTYEFETRAPLTTRGTLEAGYEGVLARRAIQNAKKALHPRGWTSLVVVLQKEGDGD